MAGQITTPLELITLCLRTAGVTGVGQTPQPEDMNDCFAVLNAMLGQWNAQRWLIYHLVDIACPSTGAQSYTVGPTSDFAVTRPDKLETAFARLTTSNPAMPFDYPLTIIQSREDYSALTLKKLTTFPAAVWYDSAWPVGQVYFWPIPSTQFSLHIVLKETLEQFPTITTSINLPPPYIDCLIWNLSVRIRPLYQLAPEPTIVALAKASLNVLRQSNAQVSELRMPASIMLNQTGFDPTLGNLNSLPFGS